MVADTATTLRVNFAQVLDVEPAPISCMSLNDHNDGALQLALFRGGSVGAIELWSVTHQPFLEKVLLDIEQIDGKASVESLIWVKGRLFSCGLHGFVVEHNVVSGKIKNKTPATSGPVWCLSAHPKGTMLAAGTEDGFVNIFDVDDNSLLYQKVLDRQDGRVISLHWSPCGKHIVTGSVDCIRLWDVEKGHAIQRLVTGRSKNKETIVWSVLLLDGLTIVSGDSRGFVSFWDGRVGVLKFKIQTHKADVLSVRLAQDKMNIYAAGVDPVVVLITKVGNSDKWVKSHQRNMHLNDVMALETYGNRLFSGGVDAELTVSSFPPKIVTKYPPFLCSPHVLASQCHQRILTKQAKSISLWNLPTQNTDLVKILDVESKSQQTVFSICLNHSGNVFGYSSANNIRFFHITQQIGSSNAPELSKLKIVNPQDDTSFENASVHLQFLTEDALVMITPNGKASILRVDLTTGTVVQNETFHLGNSDSNGIGYNIQAVSQDGKHLCLSSDGNLLIFAVSLEKQNMSKCISIPTHSATATSVSFHPFEPFVLITYADNLLQVFDYKEGRIVLYQRMKKNAEDLYPFLGSTWSLKGRQAVLYQADSIKLLEMEPEEMPRPKKQKSASSKEDKYIFAVKSCAKHKYVAYAGFCNENQDLVVVEVNPNGLLERLPPSFVKKRFGS